jgi:cell division protein FtsB
MTLKFETNWDKTVFISSIIGLFFLIVISLFRYYYLIPAQNDASSNYAYIQSLRQENANLKAEIKSLNNKLEHENK